MRYAPLWIQAASYPAALDRWLIRAMFPNGGAAGAAPAVVTNTMNVQFPGSPSAPGLCVVPMVSQGAALCRWDAGEAVTLTAAPPAGQSRIDLVICQVRSADLGGADNDWVFTVVTGTPAASNPPVPALPTSYAYVMCQILVPGGVANLNTATLTDLRRPSLGVPGSAAQYDLAADVNPLTATTPQTLFSGLYTPGRSTVKVDFSASGFNNAAISRTFFQTVTSPTSQTRRLSAPMSGVVNQTFFAGGSALHTGLTPGTPYTFSLQAWVEAAGSFRCRAASQPALENMRLIVSDA